TRICWFTVNPNGEAEVVKVTLKPKQKIKNLQFDVDFAKLAIKGKQAMGNLVTKNEVHRFSLKEKGSSTLGGREVWFDSDVLRLNYEGRGDFLGEFQGDDKVLVILNNGEYYTSTYDATNHYPDNIMRIEKYRPGVVWTAILNDADQEFPYIKRFTFEPTAKPVRYLGENTASTLILLTDTFGAQFKVTFAAPDDFREPLIVNAWEFIGEKSFKARGKRLTTYAILQVEEIEPAAIAGGGEGEGDGEGFVIEGEDTADEPEIEPEKSDEDVRDEINGQQKLF
ncbi:MAG: DNA gyrase/topoisomerase IV subunit A, partial [Muribaculaceae bacterium]|nr:DNA gyrase/topoisomerase IV subunit A [Muribaculaceae bacterium]